MNRLSQPFNTYSTTLCLKGRLSKGSWYYRHILCTITEVLTTKTATKVWHNELNSKELVGKWESELKRCQAAEVGQCGVEGLVGSEWWREGVSAEDLIVGKWYFPVPMVTPAWFSPLAPHVSALLPFSHPVGQRSKHAAHIQYSVLALCRSSLMHILYCCQCEASAGGFRGGCVQMWDRTGRKKARRYVGFQKALYLTQFLLRSCLKSTVSFQHIVSLLVLHVTK